MPVLDHEVHDKTRLKAGKKYGCYDRKGLAHGYVGLDRYYKQDGSFVITQKYIQHNMSESCRSFYLWDTDPRCAGCESPKDKEYADTMRGLK